jgi:hypothetical protein
VKESRLGLLSWSLGCGPTSNKVEATKPIVDFMIAYTRAMSQGPLSVILNVWIRNFHVGMKKQMMEVVAKTSTISICSNKTTRANVQIPDTRKGTKESQFNTMQVDKSM